MPRSSKETSKEKYERQKALARERQRKRRANLTLEQLEKKRQYDRDRAAKLRSENKIKHINDMSEREKRKQRKYWRLCNLRRKQKKAELARVREDTPPSSSDEPLNVTPSSSKKKRGRKMVRKDRAKAYRLIQKQKTKIENLEKKIRKYKKRLSRTKAKLNPTTSPSPRKQVQSIIGIQKVSPAIKKQLFVGLVLKKQLETKVKEAAGSKKQSKLLRTVIGNKVIKKYRIQKDLKKIVPYKSNRYNDQIQNCNRTRRGIRTIESLELSKFYLDDAVSKMCPGKKDWVKIGKQKQQRRILLDTIKNLHKKYKEEHNSKISLASFARARPKWVQPPKKSDRETCGCIKHENMHLLVASLKAVKVIKEHNITEIMNSTVCSVKNEACMFSKCEKCRDNTVRFIDNNSDDLQVKYQRWTRVCEVKEIKGKKKMLKKTMKVKFVKRLSDLKTMFERELIDFKKHLFFAIKQGSSIKNKIETLGDNELLFRFDFSENYVAKYSTEIQSTHFGASKRQLSLHTGVAYSKVDRKTNVFSFCTVSDQLDHQTHAVWSHLLPILQGCAQAYPNTTGVHFVTDSPSSQYRNRMNIYLFKRMLQETFPKIQQMSWNFTEAGHGKGPMDGVGGTLKREADRMVLQGHDIKNASDFVRAHSSSRVRILEITPDKIDEFKSEVEKIKIAPIKGISKAHQVTFEIGKKMKANLLSCFDNKCFGAAKCQHYHLFEVTPVLRVEDVYTSSDDEQHDDPAPFVEENHLNDIEIKNGDFLVVKLEQTSKKSTKALKFVAVCQSDIIDRELEVMFMKESCKDKLMFFANEKDVSYVTVDQIVCKLPNPKLEMKGNRHFYKFNKYPIP